MAGPPPVALQARLPSPVGRVVAPAGGPQTERAPQQATIALAKEPARELGTPATPEGPSAGLGSRGFGWGAERHGQKRRRGWIPESEAWGGLSGDRFSSALRGNRAERRPSPKEARIFRNPNQGLDARRFGLIGSREHT